MTMNKGDKPYSTATEAGPRPGDFAIGSVLSRAAARAKLLGKASEEDVLDMVVVTLGQPLWDDRHHYIGKAHEGLRVSHLPSGLSLAEAQRIAAEHGARRLGEVWNTRQMERARDREVEM